MSRPGAGTRPPGNPPPAQPRPSAPRPTPPPRPTGPAQPARTAFLADPLIRLAAAVVVVGVLLLTAHYFAPVILLAALPVKQWRQAAMTPDRLAPALAPRRGAPPAPTCSAYRSSKPVGSNLAGGVR